MCGIAFISPAPGSGLDVPALTARLLGGLEARGRDAAGIAWRDDAGESWLIKVPGTGSRLAKSLDAYPPFDTGVRSIIVHTRWATVGNPKDNENNHPLVRPGVQLVHNGYVKNHRTLTAQYKIARTADVDTDLLAGLVEKYRGRKVLGPLGDIAGGTAVMWLDGRDDTPTVHAARVFGNPLVIAQTRDGDTIGCSTEAIMRRATEPFGITLDWVHHCQPGTYVTATNGIIDGMERFAVDTTQHWVAPDYRRLSIGGR